MATLTSSPGRGVGPLPHAAPRGATGLPRPRSRRPRALLRGVSLLLGAVALLGLAGVGSLQVLQSSRTATAGYELRTLERQRAELGAGVRLLEAEIARMANLEAIHAAAIERLGMVPPERSLRIAVAVPAPLVVPMPERYVKQAAPLPAEHVPWWERLLRSVPGLD